MVKSGYRQAEVGVIPKDWESCQLQDLTDGESTICYGIVQVGPFTSNGIPVLAIKNLNRDYASNIHRVSKGVERPYTRSRVRPGDVLVSVKGTTGRVGIVPSHFHGNISRDIARIRPRADIEPGFVFHMLQSELAQSRLTNVAVGSTRMELSIAILKRVCIPIPPTRKEQESISEALSDVDSLIESLELLVAKKRYIKQGAMRELLSGTRRLPGFSEAWEVRRLDSCFRLVNTRNAALSNNVVTISAQHGFVRQEEYFNKRVASKQLAGYYLLNRGDFAYNRSYSNGYPFGAIKRLMAYEDGVVTTLYICFGERVDAEVDGRFYEQYFECGLLNPGLSTVANEGGRAHGLLNITKADFFSREILWPPPAEQAAIAAILSDMDTEIATLDRKLAKARQIKQGMMQELLTGRTRLV